VTRDIDPTTLAERLGDGARPTVIDVRSIAVPRATWVSGLVGGGLAVAALTGTCAKG
jgi:hypothetical protein